MKTVSSSFISSDKADASADITARSPGFLMRSVRFFFFFFTCTNYSTVCLPPQPHHFCSLCVLVRSALPAACSALCIKTGISASIYTATLSHEKKNAFALLHKLLSVVLYLVLMFEESGSSRETSVIAYLT